MTHEPTNATSDSSTTVERETAQERYVIKVDAEQAGYTAYTDQGGQRIFYHTEIADRFAGKGLASALVWAALNDTRAGGMRIVTVCPYITRYLKEHHDFTDITDPVTPASLAAVTAARRRQA